jgi:drug/metabolite transporter (DMT)-like permease
MPFIGELSALAAALLWSFSSFLFTTASIRIGSIQLNISRMILAAILLVITILVFNISYDINFKQFYLLSISGFIGLVIGDTFLFKSFKEIGPRVSMLIMSSNPAIAAILAYIILGEVLSLWSIFGIAITISGISLVILDKRSQAKNKFPITRIGVFYGLMGAAGQGIGLVFAKMAFIEGDVHSLVATFVRIAAAVVIMLPAALVIKKYDNPFKLFARDRKALGMVALGSIIGPYLGITFSFLAIIYVQIGIASTIMATTPIIMLPLSWLFYKEKLTFKAVIGAIIAVLGVSMLFLL